MGEPGHSRDRTLAPRSALAVAKTSMHVINALPEMPLAIDAREKGTDLPGVLCLMDDVLVFGQDQEEHDARLLEVLQRIKSTGVTLNPAKCEFGKTSLKFLGHLIDQTGIRADPDKTAAIQKMKPPTNVSELRRFLGMVNSLGNSLQTSPTSHNR